MASKTFRDNRRFEETQKGFVNIKTDLKARFDHNKVSLFVTRGKIVWER